MDSPKGQWNKTSNNAAILDDTWKWILGLKENSSYHVHAHLPLYYRTFLFIIDTVTF